MARVIVRVLRILALGLLASFCIPASAEVFTAIGAIIAGTATTATYVTVAAYALAAASAINSMSQAIQAKKKARQAAARKYAEDVANLRDRMATLVSSEAPWATIYGSPAPVGGAVVAVLNSGPMDQYKHVLMVFAAHECEAIDEIFIAGTTVGRPNALGWTDGPEFQMPPLFSGWPSEGPAVNVQFHTSPGGVDTADAFMRQMLNDTFPNQTLWTEQHRLSGFTYAVITLDLRFERFQGGIPEITAKIRGKKVYDPRTGRTAYSRNPALCLADFLQSEVGYLAARDQIDENALIAAANVCDQAVYSAQDALDLVNYGGSQALYVCDGMFRSDQDRETTRQQLEEAMAGFSLESGGVWRIQAGAWSTPVLNLTDADMLAPTSVVQTCNSGINRFNGARGTYVNAVRNGVTEDFRPFQNAVFRGLDGKDKFSDMALPFTASHVRCHQIARVLVEQSRGGFVLRIQPKMLAWHLQPGNRIVLTSALYGFANKTFRVADWTYIRNAPLSFLVVEDVPSYYDLADETQADAAPNTNLPSPFLQPQQPTDLVVNSGPEHMVQQDSVMVVRAKVTWAASTEAAVFRGGAVRVQWRLVQTNGPWQTIDLPGDSTETYLLGLSVGGVYQVRIRFLTAYAVSGWTMVEHAVTGKSQPPGSVAGLQLTVEQDGVYARWEAPGGLDLLDWNMTQLRIGASWETGAEVFSGRTTVANLGWLQAGLAKVWAAHSDTTGRWSAPVVAAIQIAAPAQPVVTGEAWRDQVELQWPECRTTQPLRGYEVRVGNIFANAVVLSVLDALGYTYTQTTTGTHLYWVTAIDLAGNRGASGYKQLTTLPGIGEALHELQAGLDDVVVDLGTAQANLSAEITNRVNAITAEAAARTSAIGTQVTNLNKEIADRVAAVLGERNARDAAILAEQNARLNADSAEASKREALSVTMTGMKNIANTLGEVEGQSLNLDFTTDQQAVWEAPSIETLATGLIFEESTARVTADQAEIVARQALEAKVTSNKTTSDAAMLAEQTARATADSAEVTARQALSSKVTGTPDPAGATLAGLTSGLLFEERSARTNADSAEVTARQALATTVTNNKTSTDAAILAEQTARSTGDTANADSINTLSATVNSTTNGLPSKATNTALNALTTRVTNAEGTLTSQGSAITSINSGLELGRTDSQASLAGDESMANAAAWRSHYNQDLVPRFVTVADGKVATTVCRSPAGGGSFWNYSKSKVVVDPARTYRISAWIRRADANGTHYWNWWRNTLGTYGNSVIALAGLTNNTWVKISLDMLGSAFGDTSISPGFALNHSGGTTGYSEIQGFRFEDVTDSLRISTVETAKADATAVTALTTRVTTAEGKITSQAASLTNLAATVNGHTSSISTNASAIATLDGNVKATWRLNVDAGRKTSGIILDNNGLQSDFVVLADRFAWATAGTGGVTKYPVVFGNVDGVTSFGFAGNMFLDGVLKTRMIEAEAVTADKIRAKSITAEQIKAGAITADLVNVGMGANLLSNSTWLSRGGAYNAVPTGWDFYVGNIAVWEVAATPAAFVDWTPPKSQGVDLWQKTAGSGGGDQVMVLQTYFTVVPGKRYETSVYSGAHRCRIWTDIHWIDSNGATTATSRDYNVENNAEMVGGKSLSSFKRIGSFGVAPANAVSGVFRIIKYGTFSGASDSHAFLTQPMAAEASPYQTVFSTYSPAGQGTQISPTGITTPNLSSLSATIGLLRTASSGQRTEIDNNGGRAFDGNNVLRVRWGVW